MKQLTKCLQSVLLIVLYIVISIYVLYTTGKGSLSLVFYFTTANAIGILIVYILVFFCGWCYTEALIKIWNRIWSD